MRIGWVHIVLALVIAATALLFVRLHNAGGTATPADDIAAATTSR